MSWRGEEGNAWDTFKKVLLAGLNPFATFPEIDQSDIAGPFICMFLLMFVSLTESSIVASKILVKAAIGEPASPRISYGDNIIRVTLVNITGTVRSIGWYSNEFYDYLYLTAFTFGLVSWISFSAGLWIALKVLGGASATAAVLGGYTISAKVYEVLSKTAIFAIYTDKLKMVEVLVARNNVSKSTIYYYATSALVKMQGLSTALSAHAAFFAIWSIVVLSAAIQSGGVDSTRKAIAGAVIAYIASGILQYFLQGFLRMFSI